MLYTPQKITDIPFAAPGYIMKRTLNFQALAANHPQLCRALLNNPIYKLNSDVREANFRTLSKIYECDYLNSDMFDPSQNAMLIGEDSELTDSFIDALEQAGKRHSFQREVVPFLVYSCGSGAKQDFICVTPDDLYIYTDAPVTTDWIPLEDIQAIAVQENALVINGISYELKNAFAPLAEKYDALTYFIPMILAMKYPVK